ncbi:Flp family type IVb pilin [Chelativorans sp. YIM 93263]|uniref:Flp family type IVb pilin n=1 Tax=Chelativorans sp. YIM 93263 TaxID=2906648 RepID=UPI00237819BF|nr:Flp family type IVb pilin [Chelativorans sp. YIM 93263]
MFRHFLQSRDGTTAVEYALIVGILVLAIITGVTEVGRLVGETYGDVADKVSAATE